MEDSDDGGGWTLLMTLTETSDKLYGNSWWTNTEAPQDGETPDPDVNEDRVSSAFYHMEGTSTKLVLTHLCASACFHSFFLSK